MDEEAQLRERLQERQNVLNGLVQMYGFEAQKLLTIAIAAQPAQEVDFTQVQAQFMSLPARFGSSLWLPFITCGGLMGRSTRRSIFIEAKCRFIHPKLPISS